MDLDPWPRNCLTWPTVRNLYQMFRDSVIDDAIAAQDGAGSAVFISQGGRRFISPWQYLPKRPTGSAGTNNKNSDLHVGRTQTMALIRKFMKRAAEEFPEGIIINNSGFCVDEVFVEFVKTHRAAGSSHQDMIMAWQAMRSIKNG